MFARLVRYSTTSDVRDQAQRAEEGVLPLFESLPGFKAYSVADSDGEIFSMSVWETREQAEAASASAAEWVAENMPEITLEEARYGEILFSTLLGVSTKTGATV